MHGIRLPSLSIVCTAHFLSTTAFSNIISIINSAVNMTLATFAVEHHAAAPCCGAVAAGRPALSINISYLHGAQQQTCQTPLLWLSDGTDRRTDEHQTVS